MPPRKRSRLADRKKPAQKFKLGRKLVGLLIFFIILLLASFLLITRHGIWNKKDRLALAVNTNQNVTLLIFDPSAGTITSINIPQNLEVEASRQLGRWKIGSIWDLGRLEGYSGSLLAETITKSLKFPTEAWANEQALGLVGEGLHPLVRSVFARYETNLTLGDRINLAIFSFSRKPGDRVELALTDTSYVYQATLKDGVSGYILRSEMPSVLAAKVADSSISSEGKIVSIKDQTANSQTATQVGEIIQSLGAKLASIKKSDPQDIDCLVEGSASNTRQKIASIFNCEVVNSSSSVDITIVLGKRFSDRF